MNTCGLSQGLSSLIPGIPRCSLAPCLCLSLCLSVCPSVGLSVCLHVSLSLSVFSLPPSSLSLLLLPLSLSLSTLICGPIGQSSLVLCLSPSLSFALPVSISLSPHSKYIDRYVVCVYIHMYVYMYICAHMCIHTHVCLEQTHINTGCKRWLEVQLLQQGPFRSDPCRTLLVTHVVTCLGPYRNPIGNP